MGRSHLGSFDPDAPSMPSLGEPVPLDPRDLVERLMLERFPNGRAIVLDTAGESVARCRSTCIAHYAVPPETVVNLLRLPRERRPNGDWTLVYTHFDEERRVVRIVLTAEPLPADLTRTAAGIAVVGLTGTRVQILGADISELVRVESFLADKLASFKR